MELVKHSSVRKIPKGFEKEALTSKLWVLSDNAIKKHLMTERKGWELSLAANTLLTQLTEFKYRALLKHGPPSWRGALIHWLLEVANHNGNGHRRPSLILEKAFKCGGAIFILKIYDIITVQASVGSYSKYT